MYIAKLNKNENDNELCQFIHEHSFAILVSLVDGKPWASHIPLVLSADGTKLTGHLAKANIQWKQWDSSTEVLAIFQGPHSYISSSWYDHENVPTWNYIAVQVYGKIRIIEGDERLNSLRDSLNKYEKHSTHPVTIEKMTPSFLTKEINGIVAFEISITQKEGAYKLSQNRDKINHDNIVSNLNQKTDENSLAIAKAMKKQIFS